MAPRKRKVEEIEEEPEDEENEEVEEDDENSDNDSDNNSVDNDEENEDEDGEGDENEDDEEDDEDGDDEDDGKAKKKSKAKSNIKSNKKLKTNKSTKTKSKTKKIQKKSLNKAKSKSNVTSANNTSSDVKTPKVKIMTKFERLEEARKAYKWWTAPKLPDGINWNYLEHAGIVFAPPYKRHNIPLLYDNKEVVLSDEQEEIATFYAAIPDDGPQLGNVKTRKVFQNNFFEDFKKVLGNNHVIKSFDKLDFSRIKEHLDILKSLKKAATEEEKLLRKLDKELIQLKHGYALIDGRMEKMGNYNMEPPGLFRGRGEHPKTGSLKSRCLSESVSINISSDACIPKVPLPGHAWNSVQHDPSVTWLCSWNENVQNQIKYVMLAASSSFKGKSDLDKYEKAIRLKACIGKVRKDYTDKINSSDIESKQLGTAMWVIDVLALRVGGEKGEDEADTVGCCSLRLEHLKFNPNESTYEIELEFLGKDSMLFKQTINFAQHGDTGKKVYKCLKSFCSNKQSQDEVFDTLNPQILNKHLSSIMKGLSAKVFRTFNASVTLEQELPTAESLQGLSIQDKVVQYNAANRQVAILCNHQRTVSKAAEVMFENLHEKLNKLKEQRQELLDWLELVKKKKESKIPLGNDVKEKTEKLQAELHQCIQIKEKAKSTEDRIKAANDIEVARTAIREDQRERFNNKHYYKTIPTADSLESRIKKWTEDIKKLEVDIRNRDENKEVALGTSKINYMDPRISVAWCKRCEVPIDKIFAKTLRDKFNWAMAAPPDWKFE
eukprot:gene19225-25076_t